MEKDICGCGDDHCETCYPENAELSDYCKVGAFYCPYRNGATVYPKGLCDGCKYKYTKLEARLLGYGR